MQGELKWQSARFAFDRQWRPGYSNWLFFTIIFIANFNASLISSSGRALDSHSRGTGIDTRILQLVFLYNYFRCQLQHKFFVPNRKGWRIEKLYKGGLAQVVERSIRIREAPGSIPGFSNQFFFTIIFVANCNTSFLCQTEKVGEQKKCARGLAQVVERSIRIREAPGSRHGYSNWLFFTIIFIANFNASLLCQTEKRKETKYLKWQSARFAFESTGYPDSPISFSLQLFSLPIATQVFCAKQKRLENRTNMQGGLAQVVERSIRIRQAPGWRPGYSNWLFFTIIFIANFNASLLCQTEKVEEQKKCPRGISSSGRALDSHSRGTGIDTRILQLVFLYNYFRCQLQHKFFVPNRKGWRIEQICKGDQLKWQSARFAFERHRDRYRILQLVILYNYFHCQFQRKFVVPNRKG